MQKDPDFELVVRIASGDEYAFEQLIKNYQKPVLATIYRYIGDSSISQDLAQDVFVKVWEKAGTFKGNSKFSTWLYRIVVNHCLNYQAKRKRKPVLELNESTPDPNPSITDRLETQRKSDIVRKAVDELPQRQRIALVLSKYGEKSYTEIADIMKVSLSTVESLIFRAKKNLKKTLLPFRKRGEL